MEGQIGAAGTTFPIASGTFSICTVIRRVSRPLKTRTLCGVDARTRALRRDRLRSETVRPSSQVPQDVAEMGDQ
jgi:hypothetical protein